MPKQNNIKFSVVSPVYGSLNVLEELVERTAQSLGQLSEHYEIILVDDCGPGNAWERIQNLAQQDPRIKGIKLSRNFGQHYAISAGLQHSSGQWVVVMDCDLQDQPEEIAQLYAKTKEAYDVVLAKRSQRQDGWFKKISSKGFYKVLSYLTGIQYDPDIANFGIYHQKVITAINDLPEHIRFFPSMVRWVGFNTTSIDVVHAARKDGDSSYNLNKLLNLALDIMLAYSDKPLRLTVKLGLLISFLSLIFIVITIARYFIGEITVEGYFSIILSVWLLGGLLIFIMGIVGLYIGQTFEGVKDRPIFIVDKSINLD